MPIASHIRLTKIKKGDTVRIVDTLDAYVSHVTRLNTFIGKSGVIIEADDGGDDISYCIELESDRFWWFPEASLQKIGEKECLPECDIRPHLNVTVGKNIDSLKLNDMYHNTRRLNSKTKRSSVSLFGKTGKIISENFIHNIKQHHNEKMDTYVGVEIDGAVYYLPKCVLFDLTPTYNPKTIVI